MLWRFGLQHASNIDKLLEKEDLTLEEVLNDPDLLQEVREQNTKVVSYLSRPQNLKQMVDYIATEEFFKFSKMASTSVEVLCSNSVTFVECLISTYSHRDFAESDDDDAENSEVSDSDVDDGDNDNAEQEKASDGNQRSSSPAVAATTTADSDDNNDAAGSNRLTPQRSRSDNALSQQPTRQEIMSSPFTSSSNIIGGGGGGGNNNGGGSSSNVPRQHLLEALWGVMGLPAGQLDGLQAAYFSRIMCGLLQRKPYETLDFIRAQGNTIPLFLEHLGVTTVVDLLLKIISLEELDNGPGIIAWLNEYRLIPMLVDRLSPECDPEMHSLATQVLLDIIAISQCNNPAQPTIGTNALIEELKSQEMVTRLTDYMLDRSAPHATSTLINCVYIFIELIRRNYSDADAEMSPDDQGNGYGFGGTYDNASYDQQQQASLPRRLPTVDLSDMMRVLALRTKDLVELLKSPRSATEPVPTTMGLREPLGFERLRICELFAELLHCSNMPRLNMPVDKAQGIESVAVAVGVAGINSVDAAGDIDGSPRTDAEDSPSYKDSPTVVGFPHQRGNSSPSSQSFAQQPTSPSPAKSSSSSSSSSRRQTPSAADDIGTPGGYASIPIEISSPSDHDTSNTPVGQLLKWNLIQHGVLPICTDLFFRFSLNNFLHSVVYDIMHQVLNLPLTLECNLALIVVAFRDVRITSRIAQACAQNDQVCHEPRGVRLGYMGHLTGIGEEVARLLELSGAALEPLIAPFIDGDEWLDYVARTLQEVRERDQQPLGGERPGGTVDILASDNADQVFVSRMGLVDPSSGESYGPEDDDEDVDDEDMDEDDDEDDDDEDRYTASTRRNMAKGYSGRIGYHSIEASASATSPAAGSAGSTTGMLYPTNGDDGEDSSEYVAEKQGVHFDGGSVQFGMHASMADDADQFIIKDDDDDDDGYHNDGGIGPAGRIGRFRSYQNERSGMAYSEDDDDDVEDDGMSVFKRGSSQGSAMDEDVDDDDDDDDSASEIGGNNDFMRDRAADLVEAARQQRSSPVVMSASNGNGNSNGNGGFVDDQGSRGRAMMAPAVDDDESVDWADFSTFGNQQISQAPLASAAHRNNMTVDDEFGDWQGGFIPMVSPKPAANIPVDSSKQRGSDSVEDDEDDIDRLSEMLEVLKE